MSLVCFSREFLWLLSSYLWLDTSVEYEFRNVQIKLQSGDRIDGTSSFISVMRWKDGKKIFERSCFLGEGIQSTVLEWQREWMKNGMKEMLLFVTLWYHTALYVGGNIRRMFLKALEGFSFSVGNISNCDNFVMTPYLFCTFYVCYHNQ